MQDKVERIDARLNNGEYDGREAGFLIGFHGEEPEMSEEEL